MNFEKIKNVIIMLKEVRFYSRGGQGGVTGAKLLAYAGALQGLEVQAIPKYGAERKGAPIFVDVRLSDKPIRTHSPVGNDADYFIILEPSLLSKLPSIRENALIVVNAKQLPETQLDLSKNKVGVVDAYKIAEEENLIKSGTPLVSTIMIGAWAKASNELISMKNIQLAVNKYFSGTLAQKNINGITKAYSEYKDLEVQEMLTS